MRVLCVAAHPDDEVLGVGGTLLRHVEQGDDVHILIAVTNGLRDRMQRLDAAKAVAKEIGATVDFGWSSELGYEVPSLDVKDAEIVYTHHPGDLNRDHRLVARRIPPSVVGKPARTGGTPTTSWSGCDRATHEGSLRSGAPR